MLITICGSVKFIKEMSVVGAQLENMGHKVLLPESVNLGQDKVFWQELLDRDIEKFYSMKKDRMKGHFDKVRNSDAILVLNYDKDGAKNYIGPNTFLEMAIAFDLGKKIFLLNPLEGDDPKHEELMTMSPICTNGDLNKIN